MSAVAHPCKPPCLRRPVQRSCRWHRQHQACTARSRRCHRCCNASAGTAAAAPASSRELHSWLQQKGAQLHHCSIREGDAGQLELAAVRDVQAGENVLSIPQAAWVTRDTVKQSSIGQQVSGLAVWLQLALWLMLERGRGAGSSWAPYLATMPDRPDVPVMWSEEQLQLLQGTQVHDTAMGYRQFFSSQYSELQQTLLQHHPDAFPAADFSEEAFAWAAVTVRARVHPPLQGDQAALVPGADLAQHRRGTAGAWRVQGGGFGRGRTLTLPAGAALAAGEPVVIDYGPEQLDSQLLLDYGVLDKGTPQAGFLLTLSLPEDDRFVDDKADVLDINGLAEASAFMLRPDRAPAQELMAYLRLLNVQGSDAFLLESLFRNEVWGFMQMPVSRENEAMVCQSMVDGCRTALRQYPTSIDEDLALLRDTLPGTWQHKAIAVRLGEKETLDVMMRYFEDRSSKLPQLEYYQERRLKGLGLLDDEGDSTWDGFFKDGVA